MGGDSNHALETGVMKHSFKMELGRTLLDGVSEMRVQISWDSNTCNNVTARIEISLCARIIILTTKIK